MFSVLRLAPWRRGWRLLWRVPSVWWALLSVGAVLGLTMALPPLYLGSTASASFGAQVATRCPWLVGLQARSTQPTPADVAARSTGPQLATALLGPTAHAVYAADARSGHLGAAVTSFLLGGTIAGAPGAGDEPTTVLYRDTAEQHVRVTSRVPGDGVLLTDRVATSLHVRAGDTVAFRTLAGPLSRWHVVGTYHDLAADPVLPFFCSLDRVIHLQDAFGNNVPPPVALATSPSVALGITRALNPQALLTGIVERPLAPLHRIDQGEQALRVVGVAKTRSATSEYLVGNALRTDLPFLVDRAHAVQAALTPPITAIAAGAGLAALGLVGIAGSFWAERRRTELDLLAARGVGPGALAVKASIECAAPLLAGVLAGTALASGLVLLFGPASVVTPGSLRTAVLLAPPGWLLAGLVVAGAVRWRLRQVRAVGRRRLRLLPVTAVDGSLLVAALVALRRISPLAISSDSEALPSFGLGRLVLPLLVLVLVARLVTRGAVGLLGILRGRGDGWRVPVLLAVQRLAAVPRVPAALAVTVSVACGTCLYATGLAGSLHRTVDAKASVFVGGRSSIELNGRTPLPHVPGGDTVTPVLSLARPRLDVPGRPKVTVLAIDPRTFARSATWDTQYADRSLPGLLQQLSEADGVGAIAVGDVPDDATVILDLASPYSVQAHVVARPRAFPGMRQQPLLVVSTAALERAYPRATDAATEQLWTQQPVQPLAGRLRAAGVSVRSTLEVAAVSTAPSLEAVLQTLAVLRALGLLVAILAGLGLVVYVDVRARQRRLASVLTRRMGLRARADWVASWLELGGAAGLGLLVGAGTGLGLVDYVSALLDPVPLIPPGPLVSLPLAYAAGLAAATVTLTAIAALVSLRGSSSDAAVLRAA